MPVLTFLSDYGLLDEFVGVCHGVIARIAPEVRVIDISHGVQRHDVRSGALMLRGALPYMPAGVHLGVVDPDVGGRRRAGALRCAEEERILVGPDNGLLMLAAERFGGVVEAIEIGRSPHRLPARVAALPRRRTFPPGPSPCRRPSPAATSSRRSRRGSPRARRSPTRATRWRPTSSSPSTSRAPA